MRALRFNKFLSQKLRKLCDNFVGYESTTPQRVGYELTESGYETSDWYESSMYETTGYRYRLPEERETELQLKSVCKNLVV